MLALGRMLVGEEPEKDDNSWTFYENEKEGFH